jgi:serine/threonine protein phosphatase 1
MLARRGKRPGVPDGQRIYAVGDIHGRADLLAALLTRIDEDLKASPIANPIQIFVGDYIDRGPRSRDVIDMLIARKRKHRIVCLKGNHEDYVSQVLNDPEKLQEWKQVGGISTLLSYGLDPSRRADRDTDRNIANAFRQAVPDGHHRFIESLVLSFTCGDFFFAHAGVRPGVPLHQQSQLDLLWIRDDFLLHEEDFGKVIVHGHTPTIEPDIRPNRINIDTGAFATGRLTCLVIEADQISFL